MKKILISALFLPFALSAQNTLQMEISAQNNDAEVRANNTVDFGSSDLELSGKDGTVSQETYLRFEGISLPSDAVINNAYLILYGDEASSSPTVIKITGETGNSLAYPVSTAATTGLNIKSRNYTTAFAEWATNGCVVNQKYQSPDLKNILHEMFPNGINNANLAFRLQGNEQGAFTVRSFSNTAYRPKLVIDYWSMQGSLSAVVTANNDDGWENTSGGVNLGTDYLRLGGVADVKKHAVRFQNVQIPADAQITDAYIEFYSYGASQAGNMDIYSEIGNPATYAGTAKNITLRERSVNKVNWSTTAWTTGNTKNRTPNLKNIIEENRLSGWQSGNSLAFQFDGLGTNNGAIARSYEGGANYRPKLVVEYLNNGQGASIEGAVTDPALMNELYINEVSSQGTTVQSEDWIELYNNSNDHLHIQGGVYLSNKNSDKTLHELKNIFIPAHGYAVFLADKKSAEGNQHLNFDLKNSGATLYLSRKVAGNIVLQNELTYGNIPFNQSVGRLPDGGGSFSNFIVPTYKETNSNGKQKLELTFSKERGIYPSGFDLTISAPAGTTVKYTLDGKYPSETVGSLYSAPIPVSKSSVVKVYAYNTTGNSGVVAHTYVLQNNYGNENTSVGYNQWLYKSTITAEEYAQAIAQIPVVSVSTNAEPSANWVEGSFEYIDNNIYSGRSNFFSNSMTRKFGQESLGFYNPNLTVKFNSDAKVKKANYPFFDNYPGDAFEVPEKIHNIELKQGQDNATRNVFNIGYMRFSEKITMNLQKEMGKYALDTRYVNLFINGRYRGLKTMRNDFGTKNIEELFGDDDSHYTKITLQDGSFTNGIVETGDGSTAVWNAIKSAASTKNFQQFKSLVDVDDFIKFQIMFMFIDCENEAEAITHNTDPNIMKTKFMINDTDGAFFGGLTASSSTVALNPIGFAGGGGNYKFKWQGTISRNGPGQLFSQFMGSNTNISIGNLEFKTLVKDAVLRYIGPASGTFSGADGAPLSVLNVQNKITATVNELDKVYKLDAAYMGYTGNVYQQWKNTDYPRILAQVPERVGFTLKKWLEFNMAHTLSSSTILAANVVKDTDTIQIDNPNSGTELYYTLNGTDPMGNDGVISSEAHLYNGTFSLPAGSYTIATRAFVTNNWGPLVSKAVRVEAQQAGQFVITGINYKPLSNGDAEFILIANPGHADLDVSGYTISDAVNYTFPQGTVIPKNKTIMLAKNLSLISGFDEYTKYQWTSGSLNNSGEAMTFKDSAGSTIDQVSYTNVSPWPVEANGQGYYLKLKASDLDNALPESWEAKSLTFSQAKMISSKAAEKEGDIMVKSVKIYPNPVKDILFISLKEKSVIRVYTSGGQLIETKSLDEGEHSVNVSSWNRGTYLIRVSGQKEVKTYKIMKE
ncbi:hypothetical protein B0A69_02155 [Chryseobacterium shigense]|uniref:Por secretion system C-terminal sorting domain-containing protein n=1 Tax=Chryseobacterium shigense TaxID=297244 RepID=A0A1N7I9D9_9FLAO|nr:lamin tail domain-containing protein [Chryseobacterium shigense]PQA96891.1 hypothetical protein B0A69_02155 [Chryseobacterium shigense]SIS33667.1 Por secretion system C-terminal sorting domain-containing protein [Chryseobacterium shigense]